MNIVEFIGFIITMAALMILSIKRSREEKKIRENPELYAKQKKEQEKALKELLRSMNLDVKEDEEEELEEAIPPPPPPEEPLPQRRTHEPHRTLSKDFELHSSIEDRNQKSRIEQRQFKSSIENRNRIRNKPSIVSSDMRASQPIFGGLEYRNKQRISGKDLLNKLPSKKGMVVLHEVFSSPLGLRGPTDARWRNKY